MLPRTRPPSGGWGLEETAAVPEDAHGHRVHRARLHRRHRALLVAKPNRRQATRAAGAVCVDRARSAQASHRGLAHMVRIANRAAAIRSIATTHPTHRRHDLAVVARVAVVIDGARAH